MVGLTVLAITTKLVPVTQKIVQVVEDYEDHTGDISTAMKRKKKSTVRCHVMLDMHLVSDH